MEKDLISREALLKELRDWGHSLDSLNENVLIMAIEYTCERIEEFPDVNAEPVRWGRWEFIGPHQPPYRTTYFGTCSACKERIILDPEHKKYCPNCGAKIKERIVKDTQKLIPKTCPNCGGTPKVFQKRGKSWVECDGDCWTQTDKYWAEWEAILEWNNIQPKTEDGEEVSN